MNNRSEDVGIELPLALVKNTFSYHLASTQNEFSSQQR